MGNGEYDTFLFTSIKNNFTTIALWFFFRLICQNIFSMCLKIITCWTFACQSMSYLYALRVPYSLFVEQFWAQRQRKRPLLAANSRLRTSEYFGRHFMGGKASKRPIAKATNYHGWHTFLLFEIMAGTKMGSCSRCNSLWRIHVWEFESFPWQPIRTIWRWLLTSSSFCFSLEWTRLFDSHSD